MRQLTRFSALAASLLLLAIPAAGACDELMDAMLGCSQAGVAQAPVGATCHGTGQAPMDCCVTSPSAGPERATAVEATTALFSPELSSGGATETLAVHQYPAATDEKPPGWRGPARYALFSSYLI